jgi:hypothetical protein
MSSRDLTPQMIHLLRTMDETPRAPVINDVACWATAEALLRRGFLRRAVHGQGVERVSGFALTESGAELKRISMKVTLKPWPKGSLSR